MYSSTVGILAASASAMPYIPTARPVAATTNQATWPAEVCSSAPRSTVAAISTTTWSAVTATATVRFARTISERSIGAASWSRLAPDWRSTRTPMPANIVFSGISRAAVPMAAKLM